LLVVGCWLLVKNGQRQRQKQIPPLRCGMTNIKGLRNDKQRTSKGKGQYGDSGCARMTNKCRRRRKGKFCPSEVFSCGRLKSRGER
jgi:hypothetical protein